MGKEYKMVWRDGSMVKVARGSGYEIKENGDSTLIVFDGDLGQLVINARQLISIS